MGAAAILVVSARNLSAKFSLPHPKESPYEIGPVVLEMFENVNEQMDGRQRIYLIAHLCAFGELKMSK